MEMNENDLIAVLQKSIRILKCFSEKNKTLSLNDLCKKTGLAKTTTHRIIKTLIFEGWIIQDDYTKRYSIGYGLMGFENLISIKDNLIAIAEPEMFEMRDFFNETVTLTILEHEHARCIHKAENDHPIKLTSVVGSYMPLYAGATSKALLAFTSDEFIENYLNHVELRKYNQNTVVDKKSIKEELMHIRSQGYSESNSEVDLDTITFCAPIFRKDNRILACISISMPTYRYQESLKELLVHNVIKHSKSINSKIAGQ